MGVMEQDPQARGLRPNRRRKQALLGAHASCGVAGEPPALSLSCLARPHCSQLESLFPLRPQASFLIPDLMPSLPA